jgi:hypothetical protein
MDNWKDAKVRYGDFSISNASEFSPLGATLVGLRQVERNLRNGKKYSFYQDTRFQYGSLTVFFFTLASEGDWFARRLRPVTILHVKASKTLLTMLIRDPYSAFTIESILRPTSTPTLKRTMLL